jgi:hypothetical protein
MSAAFLIGPEQEKQLKEAAARAREHPLSAEIMRHVGIKNKKLVRLEDRPPMAEALVRRVETVYIPFGYRVNISYEEHPEGICIHVSMCSPTPRKTLPQPEAMVMVMEALGFPKGKYAGASWIEEYPDGDAVARAGNMVMCVEPREGSPGGVYKSSDR